MSCGSQKPKDDYAKVSVNSFAVSNIVQNTDLADTIIPRLQQKLILSREGFLLFVFREYFIEPKKPLIPICLLIIEKKTNDFGVYNILFQLIAPSGAGAGAGAGTGIGIGIGIGCNMQYEQLM